MNDGRPSATGVTTRDSSAPVDEMIELLRQVMDDRGFTVFNVIDHKGVAERAGVTIPESKLVLFGKPAVGATVMLAAPLTGLDVPLKVLVWENEAGSTSVSYNSPDFIAERYDLDGDLRSPFDAVASIVEAAFTP
jgi:uncharacterized protein (DUF302 family)